MKTCPKCNNEFVETKDKKIYCSHLCQAREAIKRANLSRKPRLKTGKIYNCLICNKEFYARPCRVKFGKVKYCSRSCLAKAELHKYKEFGFKSTGLPRHKYKYININGKQIREHRYIMEQHLKRKLDSWEHVHHINNDPLDNRLENLIVLSNSDHQREEYKFRKQITS